MAQGFKAYNADGDILLSTEDNNEYFWIEDYTSGGVTNYGTGNATLAGSALEIPFSSIDVDSNNTKLNLSDDLFFINVPSTRVTDAGIDGYPNGGFVALNAKRDAISFQGVSTGTDFPWVKPRTMTNFAGAETGYGINVYNSGGKEGGQSELKWSSNAQGHLDIVAVGRWSTLLQAGEKWFDFGPLSVAKGPYYVLMHHTLGLGVDSGSPYYRAPCYEFRYPATGDNMVIRLHASFAYPDYATAPTTSASQAGIHEWTPIIVYGYSTIPPGYYMIVRERP